MKRGDHRRRRTVGRIKCAGGDGGDPVWAHHAGPYVRLPCSKPSARAFEFGRHAQTTLG